MTPDITILTTGEDEPTGPELTRSDLRPGDIVRDSLGDLRLVLRDFDDVHGDEISTVWVRKYRASLFNPDVDTYGSTYVRINGAVEISFR